MKTITNLLNNLTINLIIMSYVYSETKFGRFQGIRVGNGRPFWRFFNLTANK